MSENREFTPAEQALLNAGRIVFVNDPSLNELRYQQWVADHKKKFPDFDPHFDRYAEQQWQRAYWLDKLKLAGVIIMVIAGLIILFSVPASAADLGRLQSSRPQGFFGDGHADNHSHYNGIRNKQGGDCCSGTDCRPTQARWNNRTSLWEAMIDGIWTPVNNQFLVLDDAFLAAQGHPRWDTQAHVCASSRSMQGSVTVYCLIPPGSGQ